MRWLAIPLLCLPLLAGAQSNERHDLAVERDALMQRFAAEERVCRERFVVTSCVDDVKQRRRAALGPLREREMQLADADRLRRSQERQAARASRPLPVPTPMRAASAESTTAMPSLAAPLATSNAPAARRADGLRAEEELARSAQAAGRAREAARRTEAAQETRAEIARRQAQRLNNPKHSAPLPTPAAPAGKP